MSKICLVRPLLSATDFNGYPLNLLILGSSLRDAGHGPIIKDYDFYKEIDSSWDSPEFAKRAALDIINTDADIVGITSMCSNYVLALDLASELKKIRPDIHIVFGGSHVALCPKETLDRYKQVDTCILGEGEVTFPELVNYIEGRKPLHEVEGIGFRDANEKTVINKRRPLLKNLSESPRPAYDLIDLKAYMEVAKDIYLQIYTGSGCPFACTFCSTSVVWERKYRVMEAQRVVDEMEFLHKEYGATHFNCIHDNLSVNKKYIRTIAELITERNLDIKWGFSSRIDTLDEETAQVVGKAGCNYIFFGVESASTKIQKTMGKRLKIDMIHNAIRYCLENNIMPTTSFILGFPDEDKSDIEETIRLAFGCKINGAWRSFINLLSPYTGTTLMLNSDKLHLDWDYVNSTMVSFLYDHHFKLIEEDPYIFANYYFLDYEKSYLKAGEYSNIVDFYTMCLFKYPYTISCLINDLDISPIFIFRYFESQVKQLDFKDRDRLNIVINESDLLQITKDVIVNEDHLLSTLYYDQSILDTSIMNNKVLYKGNIYFSEEIPENLMKQAITSDKLEYLLHVNIGGQIETYELTKTQFKYYEDMGIPMYSVDSTLKENGGVVNG